jgi:hypothetical protein
VALAPMGEFGWNGLGWALLNQQKLEEVEAAFLGVWN